MEINKKNKKRIFYSRCSIRLGKDSKFNTFFAGRPLCSIELSKQYLILSIEHLEDFILRFVWTNYYQWYGVFEFNEIPRKINLSYKDIIGYNLKIKRERLVLIHQNQKYPSFIEVRLDMNSLTQIVNYLKINGLKEIEIPPEPLKNIIQFIFFGGTAILLLILLPKLKWGELVSTVIFISYGILCFIIKKIISKYLIKKRGKN